MADAGIVIVGAGLAGLATALALHRNGVKCLVLESSDNLRTSGYALTLWTNAWRALDALGVGNKLRDQIPQLERMEMISLNSGSVTSIDLTTKGKCGRHEVRCVRRIKLVEALAEELPEGTIRFSSKVVSIEDEGRSKLLRLADGSVVKTEVLVGCDGLNSVVAKWMGVKAPSFTGRYSSRGMATYPRGHGFDLEFIRYFGKGYRSGMVPCDEKSIYWYFTWTPDENEEVDFHDVDQVRKLVLTKMRSTNTQEHLSQVVEKSERDTIFSTTLKFRPPFELLRADIYRQNVCLAGDAFHPMTPDLGQGGCAALEDGLILANCLSEALFRDGQMMGNDAENDGICAALKKYADKRKYRVLDLVATSYLFGLIQESKSSIVNLLRDWFLSNLMGSRFLSEADFDFAKA